MSFPTPGAGITYPRPCSVFCAIKIILRRRLARIACEEHILRRLAHIASTSTIEITPESTYQPPGDQRDHESSTNVPPAVATAAAPTTTTTPTPPPTSSADVPAHIAPTSTIEIIPESTAWRVRSKRCVKSAHENKSS
jgi:hypothetical protein